MVNSTKGTFAEVDIFDIGRVNTIIGDVVEPSPVRANLCEDTRATNHRMAGNRNKPIETGEYGTADDFGKEVIVRDESVSFHRYAINLGISERARALANDSGNMLGTLGTQIELGMARMRDNEDSRIFYDILTESDLSSFTNVVGGTSVHQDAADTPNVVTIEECANWIKTMRKSKGQPKFFYCGVNPWDAIAQEFAMSLNFASPQAAGWLTNGEIGKILGVEVIYDERMPDDYMILAGTVMKRKPMVFYDLVPLKVDNRVPSMGLIGAEMNHDFAVKAVGYEGLLCVYTGSTSWSTPAASVFPLLEQ